MIWAHIQQVLGNGATISLAVVAPLMCKMIDSKKCGSCLQTLYVPAANYVPGRDSETVSVCMQQCTALQQCLGLGFSSFMEFTCFECSMLAVKCLDAINSFVLSLENWCDSDPFSH